jgi:uncharacterized protein YukE
MSFDRWYERFPIRVDVDALQAATDKLMQQDQEWIAGEEIVREDMRVAFQEWIEQRIEDILDDPVGETNRAWSGFDQVLDRIKRKHRAKVETSSLAVVVTKGMYDAANTAYSQVWEGQQVIGSDAEQQAWDRMVAARGAYLDAIERALTGKESDSDRQE